MRSSAGKRRWVTKRTIMGVIRVATTNKLATTITGVASAITISGTSTVLSLPAPMDSSQDHSWLSRSEDSSNSCTAASAGSM